MAAVEEATPVTVEAGAPSQQQQQQDVTMADADNAAMEGVENTTAAAAPAEAVATEGGVGDVQEAESQPVEHGPRMAKLQRVFAKALEKTLESSSFDAVQHLMSENVPEDKSAFVRQCYDITREHLRKALLAEFDLIVAEGDVVSLLNDLDRRIERHNASSRAAAEAAGDKENSAP